MTSSNVSIEPFVVNPRIKKLFTLFDTLREQNRRYGAVSCVLISGESGCGKSEIAERYVLKNPSIEEEERTFKPVVHYELRKTVSSIKTFLEGVLVAIGDPQKGKGPNKEDLLNRLITLSRAVGLELLILDEIQVIIQRRSERVISDLADLFKDLIKELKIPIVFMGMPWTEYLVDANRQLKGRIKYRFAIPPFKVSKKEYLDEYRKFLKKISDHYKIPDGFKIYEREMALRFFAYSSGNVRDTVTLLRDAYMYSDGDGSKITLDTLQDVLQGYGIPDEQNQFMLQLEDLELRELVIHSDWNFRARVKEESIIDGKYATFGVSKDRKLFALRGVA